MMLRKFARLTRVAGRVVEPLEKRCLLSATVISQIPGETIAAGSTPAPISLSTYFDDRTITPGDTLVDIQTNLPAPNNLIPLLLTDAATPKTVANFLKYVNSGEYNNTIFHRSIPQFIVQGGGDTTTGSQIQSFGDIPGESSTATLTNTPGTIAMALSSGPDTGSDEWFFNLVNNNGSSPPYNINLNDTSDGGPFTAFGSVVYNGMSALNAIAAFPTVDGTSITQEWQNLPLQNFSGASGSAISELPANNQFIIINPAVDPLRGLTYSASSSDSSIVSTSISAGSLTLTPIASTGTANITVMATDLGGGTASSTFTVTLGNVTPPPPPPPPVLFSATVGAGAAKSMTYIDADGTTGVITLKGGGTATVEFNGTDLSQTTTKTGIEIVGAGQSVADISTTGTTAASVLTLLTKGGTKEVNVGGLGTSSLKSFVGTGVTLTGDVTASGSIGTLTIAGAQSGTVSAASLGTAAVSGDFSDNLTLTAGGVSLARFTAASVSAGTWTIAGSVGALNVNKEDLSATISAASITKLQVKGNLNAATVDLTSAGDDINSLAITGSITGSLINGAGVIGVMSALSLVNSEIYAGVGNLTTGQILPDSFTDFVHDESIKSVRLKITPGSNSFSNSAIAAANIGTLSLGTVPTGAPGVAADTVGVLSATTNKRFSVRKITVSTDLATILTKDGVSAATDSFLALF
jgi:cyclophilin family peptidyl-prolyl cis-trans isomerase